MEYLYALVFGLVGTGVMTLVLYLISQIGAQSVAQVKGIGSAIPTPSGGSLVPGTAVHIAVGLIFGLVYLALGRQFAYLVPGALLGLGAGVGFVRGIVVSIVLGLIAFDREPLNRMNEAGPAVGIVHVIGNVIYGLCVSVLFGLSAIDYAVAF
jgi:hypothetical protein